MVCEKTMFQYIDGIQYERSKLKDQMSTLTFGIYL